MQIPDWPPYKVRVSDLQVISYHTGKPYELKRLKSNTIYNRFVDGYSLYYKGSRSFKTLLDLQAIINQEKEKEMSIMASAKGGLKSGDLIIGSMNKITGAFSTTANPCVHSNMTAAKTEAARLANIDKSKKYVILRVEAIAAVNDVNWE